MTKVFQELEEMRKWATELFYDLDIALSPLELPLFHGQVAWHGGAEVKYGSDKAPTSFTLTFELPCGFAVTIARVVGHPRVQVTVFLQEEDRKELERFPGGYYRGTDFPGVESASAEKIAEFIAEAVRSLAQACVRVDDQRLQQSRANLRAFTRPYSPAKLAVLQRHDLPSQVAEFLFSAERGDPVGERGVEVDVNTAREEAYYRAIEWVNEHPEVDQVELYYSGLTEATLGAIKGLESKGLVVYAMRYNRKTKTYERLPSVP